MIVRPRRSDRREDRGAAAVEFALVLPFLLLIVFALIQYGLYFYAAQTGSNTVNAAARQLSVGNCQTSGSLQTFVDNRLGAASTANATIVPVFKDVDGSDPDAMPHAANVEVGGTVKLTIEFQSIDLNFPFVPFLDNAVVYREVVARVEDTTDEGCGA